MDAIRVTPEAGPDPGTRAAKRARVLAILDERGADAVVLTSAGVLNWYLDGARTHVSLAADPVLAVVVARDGDEVHTVDNERVRLIDEELPPDVRVISVPWFEGVTVVRPAGRVLDESDVSGELRSARAALLPVERLRYESVCRDAANALTDALSRLSPSMAEADVAAAVSSALLERSLDPLVILVAGRSRLHLRHPLPTREPLGDRAMVVVCARRHGLIANVTRWVRFGGPVAAEHDASMRLLVVEAAYLDATTEGSTHGAILDQGSRAYGRFGFEPDEWKRHHQGGAAGYLGRDPRAVPGTADVAQLFQAFTWNPSAPGVKVEDTVLLVPGGVKLLSVDERWPTVTVSGRQRPIELELPR